MDKCLNILHLTNREQNLHWDMKCKSQWKGLEVPWKPVGKASGEELESLIGVVLHGIGTSSEQDMLCHPSNQQGNTGHSEFLCSTHMENP